MMSTLQARILRQRVVAALMILSLVLSLFITVTAEDGGDVDGGDIYIASESGEDNGDGEPQEPDGLPAEEPGEPEQPADPETEKEPEELEPGDGEDGNDGEEPNQNSGSEEDGDPQQPTEGGAESTEPEEPSGQAQGGEPTDSKEDDGEPTEKQEEDGKEDEKSPLDFLGFSYDDQPAAAFEVQDLVDGFEGDLTSLPKWKDALNPEWLPTGWTQQQFTDDETGAEYWRLVPLSAAMPMAAPFGMPVEVDGFDGLQQAVEDAVDGDVIVITDDIEFTDTITISGKGVTLTSPDDDAFTLTQDSGRHFAVSSGASLTIGNLVLDGDGTGGGIKVSGELTLQDGGVIKNCNSTIHNGGGVYVDSNSAFTMKGGKISDNTTNVIVGRGGGVYVDDNGTFTMEAGEISGNRAYCGGGVFIASNSAFTMEAGEISGNTATEYGGGVYVHNSTFTMESGEISGNTTTEYGGGVYLYIGAFTMKGGEISGNTANSGGGICVDSNSAFTIEAGEISDNTANTGGGVYVIRDNTFTMKGGKISGNTATKYGGGVCIDGSRSPCTMEAGEISGNKARDGGGVYIHNSAFTMKGGEISGNEADSGGVYIHNSTFTMKGGEISGNEADSGGGVYLYIGAFTMEAGEISDNTANTGGGIHVGFGTFTMKGGKISGNTTNTTHTTHTPFGCGGGVYVDSTGTFTMEAGEISGNGADRGGGGVYVKSGAFTMEAGEISGNTATYFGGGGVYVSCSSTFTMKGGKISDNTSNNTIVGYGGGVYVEGTGGTFTMEDGEISDNTAYGYGGGVYVDENSTFTMKDGKITGNTATEYGGGVYVKSDAFTMESGEISDNTANTGGGIHVDRFGTFTMKGGKISGNRAYDHGGGIYVGLLSSATIKNGQIYGNTATGNGGGIYAEDRETLIVESAAIFSGNMASKAYQMTDTADIAQHTRLIKATAFTNGMQYAYNNLDINYIIGTPALPPHTVTFLSDGVMVETKTVPDGGKVLPPSPTKEGYTIEGWYRQDTGVQWNFILDSVTSDVTLVANWQPVIQPPLTTYTLTFSADGGKGEPPVSRTLESGEETILPGRRSMTNKGHSFAGWSLAAGQDTPTYREGDAFSITGDTTLYAVWAPELYTVTYNANGGEGDAPEDDEGYYYKEKVTIEGKGNLKKQDHLFLGWSEQDNADTASYAAYRTYSMPDRDLYLFAVWASQTPEGDQHPITVEHWRYSSGQNASQAELYEAEVFAATAGQPYTAQPKAYDNYHYMQADSQYHIDTVDGEATLKLYYQQIDTGLVASEVTVEVVTRTLPDGTQAVTWNDFVSLSGMRIVYQGEVVEAPDLAFGSLAFNSINQKQLGETQVPVIATWNDGKGIQAVSGQVTLRIVDTTPPVITVANDRVTLGRGEIPKDEGYLLAKAGAGVTDNHDAHVPLQTSFLGRTFSDIDWSAPSQHAMFIDAADASGNKAATRQVIIITVGEDGGSGGSGGSGGTGGSSGGGSNIRDNLDGTYTLLDDAQVPLGTYQQDASGNWVFIAEGDVPLGTLPRTGDNSHLPTAFLLLAAGVMAAYVSYGNNKMKKA